MVEPTTLNDELIGDTKMKKIVMCGIAGLALIANAYYSDREETTVRTEWTCTWCGHTYTYDDMYYRYYEWNNSGIIYLVGQWCRFSPDNSCHKCGTKIGWDGIRPQIHPVLVEENEAARLYNKEMRENHPHEMR